MGATDKYGVGGACRANFVATELQSCALAPLAVRAYGGGTTVSPGTEYVDGRQISSQLFSVFKPRCRGVRSPEEDRPGGAPVVIISHELWQRCYGGRQRRLASRCFLMEVLLRSSASRLTVSVGRQRERIHTARSKHRAGREGIDR